MKVLVEVTASDIRAGVPGDHFRNPVTLAVGRKLNRGWYEATAAWPTSMRLRCKTGAWDASPRLPARARDLLLAFHDGLPVEPIVFRLEIPKAMLDRGSWS